MSIEDKVRDNALYSQVFSNGDDSFIKLYEALEPYKDIETIKSLYTQADIDLKEWKTRRDEFTKQKELEIRQYKHAADRAIRHEKLSKHKHLPRNLFILSVVLFIVSLFWMNRYTRVYPTPLIAIVPMILEIISFILFVLSPVACCQGIFNISQILTFRLLLPLGAYALSFVAYLPWLLY